MRDAAKLLAYGTVTILFGALVAPPVYWAVQSAIASGSLSFLAEYDFEKYFHRALLIGAVIFFWPLLRSLRMRNWRDLGLAPNPDRFRDLGVGVLVAAGPLLCFGALLLQLGIYSFRSTVPVMGLLERALSAAVVPFIEEPLFRGLILGVLLRAGAPLFPALATSAFFSILHFLKAPEGTSADVTWASGFVSIGNSFSQFQEPLLLLAGFTTLFVLGWILADARIRTRSLWLPIGLHAGWIFASAIFNKVARREVELLPWIGRNLLIGIAPFCVALLSWAILRAWLKHVESTRT